MDASFVLSGLYLGSLDSVVMTDKLRTLGVTHILTIETRPVSRHFTKGFVVKFVHAFDMESQDLLDQVDDCMTFIDEGRAGGGVIVHCFAGCSRSATIVLTYLMQKMDMSLHDAMAMLKCARPQIHPNPGFMHQLELFDAMGNRVDKTNPAYKLYRLENLAARMQEAQSLTNLPDGVLSADPSLSQGADIGRHYKCKKCRRALFKAQAQLPHQTGKGGAAFDWRSRLTSKELGLDENEAAPCTKSLFIEPVEWMQSFLLQQTGKLCCPKCQAKLGSFSWFGEHCPCGTWVTPAFHIHPSKVDECRPRLPVAAVPRRTPTTSQFTGTDQPVTSKSSLPESEESSLQIDMEKLKT